MSLHFYPLSVQEVRRETPDCVSVLFDVPEPLRESFRFLAGQSLTVRTRINGEEIRRNYSICSAPYEHELRIAIKKVEGGLFSTWANTSLRAGDQLEVMPPVGKFSAPLRNTHKKNYLAFAAGSGITPVISLVKSILASEPQSSITLVYGNRNRSSIIFFEELEAIKNSYMERFSLVHILSRERTDTDLNFGRIDTKKLAELSSLLNPAEADECFICGPQEMIFTVRDFLTAAGIPGPHIHFELFHTGKQARKDTPETDPKESGAISHITIRADGRSADIRLPLNSPATILDAALQQGADLPYACKGGMCCTCKARLLEGEVQMDVHWGLEEEEIAKGFILTCQSHPKTERVVVDFDAR